MHRIPRFVLLVAIFSFGRRVAADEWAMPEASHVCSASRRYCVDVNPRPIQSQLAFFKDKVEGREPAGGIDGAVSATARLFRTDSQGASRLEWEGPLTNEVAPVDAFVSDAGPYVITLDNWHSMGYGDDIVAIYGPKGELIRKYSLEELIGDDVHKASHSVSSIWWRGDCKVDEPLGTFRVAVKLAYSEKVAYWLVFDLKTGKFRKETEKQGA